MIRLAFIAKFGEKISTIPEIPNFS